MKTYLFFDNADLRLTVKIASAVLVLSGALYCGFLYGHRDTVVSTRSVPRAEKAHYTCPMHPSVVSERPGSCSICGMELVKKTLAAELPKGALAMVRHVALSPTQQVMANIATEPAAVAPFSKEISATGVVAYNQERQGKVTAWLAGRVELVVKSVGSRVVEGKPIAGIYSQDLVTAQEEYLLAYKALRLFGSSNVPIFSQDALVSLYEAQQRLRQLGFSQKQLDDLRQNGKPTMRVPITSPISGVITEKHVLEGQYVNVGDPLFNVADLSSVWVELEVFETDLSYLKVGQEVAITSPALPGQQLSGSVKLVYPFLDPKTRTVKLRVELPNPDLKLKPDMYVSAVIRIPCGPTLTVAPDSVMDTGQHQVVWVETAPGTFEQREVKAGARSGGRVQILSGLRPGEQVALKGGYLIDSESQLTHGGPQPPKGGLDLSDMNMAERK